MFSYISPFFFFYQRPLFWVEIMYKSFFLSSSALLIGNLLFYDFKEIIFLYSLKFSL